MKDGNERLMGFGHRVYKNYDPRAKIIKAAAEDVFEVTGRNPLLDIALELEQIALEDDYFVSRKLYPNVDFYSGLIYEALRLPVGDVPGDVRDRAHERLDRPVAGDDRRTRSRRSPARARSTRASAGATTCRSTSAPEGAPRDGGAPAVVAARPASVAGRRAGVRSDTERGPAAP